MSWPWHETNQIVLQPGIDGGLLLAEPLRGDWQKYGGQVRRFKDGHWTGSFRNQPLSSETLLVPS